MCRRFRGMMLYGHNSFLAVACFVICCFCWCSSLLVAEAQPVDPITAPSEVNALQAIKKSLVDPDKSLESWSKGGDPCTSNWTGVLCYNTSLSDGYLHVTELQLLNMNLSGSLAPELGNLSYMKILDFMWNDISGSIPKEIGSISTLELLLLNGNELTGPLPDELGNLRNLNRIQIDENHISGLLPKSFANLTAAQHFHMNNNSISGQLPFELYTLPNLLHILLDNNNLTGYLPPELSQLPKLLILQLDNNNFTGTTIPESYGNISTLLKMSLRNCKLQGTIPDFSRIPGLGYLDLSSNQLNGSIPENKLSANITTIDLSNNRLTGTIPTNFSGLPLLQKLSIANNSLNGTVPSAIWQSRSSNDLRELVVELQKNNLSSISGSIDVPQNVTVWLEGNPLCSNATLSEFCGLQSGGETTVNSTSLTGACNSQTCPSTYECFPALCPGSCFCAAPLHVQYRLKSPGLSNFTSYQTAFEVYLTSGLIIEINQLNIELFVWEKGPRVRMYLKIFPQYDVANNNSSHLFNMTEVRRIRGMFTAWKIPDSEVFGPYELLAFPLTDPYDNGLSSSSSSGINNGTLAGIIVGAIAGAVIVSAIISLFITRAYMKKHNAVSRRRLPSRITIKIDGVKDFTYKEMALATNNFDNSAQVGQGGYGKVYRGILADGTAVAIKRAQEASLQGEKEFLTEIELLSRLHHRNLVSLLGYCDEEGEQMLVYEFMPNGTLRDHLSAKSKEPLSFSMRLRMALESAKGILYLHTEADPPIFHRDIKASNILLDSKLRAKVADFGLSRLAPVPNFEGNTPAHVSTVVKGTPGYLDPEYFLTHKLTDKSDVYSLGVVFLELLTGMPPISRGKNIVREVNLVYQSGTIFSIIDGQMGSYPSECVEKFVKLAIQCCQEETDARPSMAEVVRALENIADMVPDFDFKTTTAELTSDTSGKHPSSTMSPSSSSVNNPSSMSDVSGSALISGVVPTITPR